MEADHSVAVIILTYNEEKNLPDALKHILHWADQMFLVDSFSTDRTTQIAADAGVAVYQHQFEHWAQQRNWALDNLPITAGWVLFLDADERVTPELTVEINERLMRASAETAGFYINRLFFFMGSALKHGGLWPNHVLRLVRPDVTRVKRIGAWEYFDVDGNVETLENPMLHDDQRGLTHWIDKHNRYATWEAEALLQPLSLESTGTLERAHMLKRRKGVWSRLPLLVRPLVLFVYRYIFRLGFLDGRAGFIYYLLHDFWYPLLVSCKRIEMQRSQS